MGLFQDGAAVLSSVFGAAAKQASATLEEQRKAMQARQLEKEAKDANFEPFKAVLNALGGLSKKRGGNFIVDQSVILANLLEEEKINKVFLDDSRVPLLKAAFSRPHNFIIGHEGSNELFVFSMINPEKVTVQELNSNNSKVIARALWLQEGQDSSEISIGEALESLGKWVGKVAPDRADELAVMAGSSAKTENSPARPTSQYKTPGK